MCVYRGQKEKYIDNKSINSYLKSYKNDNELHKIYFPVRLGDLKGKCSQLKFKYLWFQWKRRKKRLLGTK